ncbi:hypothetical protein BDF19DRAFT_438056 [Syncephalis fuscata]|nr:hypothetical protein BDF19DRAFT_438056 [Syncephalis fuscata]
MKHNSLFLLLLASSLLLMPLSADAFNRQRLLCLVNSHREKAKLKPLLEDSVLNVTADKICATRAKTQYQDSATPDASLLKEINTNGYRKWVTVGQAVVRGAKDEADCVQQWMANETDRARFLNPSFTRWGGSVVYNQGVGYWTAMLGDDGLPMPTDIQSCPVGENVPVEGEPGTGKTTTAPASTNYSTPISFEVPLTNQMPNDKTTPLPTSDEYSGSSPSGQTAKSPAKPVDNTLTYTPTPDVQKPSTTKTPPQPNEPMMSILPIMPVEAPTNMPSDSLESDIKITVSTKTSSGYGTAESSNAPASSNSNSVASANGEVNTPADSTSYNAETVSTESAYGFPSSTDVETDDDSNDENTFSVDTPPSSYPSSSVSVNGTNSTPNGGTTSVDTPTDSITTYGSTKSTDSQVSTTENNATIPDKTMDKSPSSGSAYGSSSGSGSYKNTKSSKDKNSKQAKKPKGNKGRKGRKSRNRHHKGSEGNPSSGNKNKNKDKGAYKDTYSTGMERAY